MFVLTNWSLEVSRSFLGFLFGLVWPLGVILGVPFGPGMLLWGPFWAFFLGLGLKVDSSS